MSDDPPAEDVGSAPVPGALLIGTRHEPGTVVLVLRGELGLDSAPLLEQSLLHAENSGVACVLIDLSELEFLDSAGLHVLIDSRERLRERGSELVLLRGPRAVQRMLELSGASAGLRFAD